jgi:hypothetical protein
MGAKRKTKVTGGDITSRLSSARRRAAMLDLLPIDVRERLQREDEGEAERELVESLSRGRR